MADPKAIKTEGDYTAEQLEATADSALLALEQAGDSAPDLVGEWVKRGNAAAVATAADRSSGIVRKTARRGINVLKSRGVAIPERRRVARVGGAEAAIVQEAWLLAPDANGSVVLVLAERSRTSRYLSTTVVLNDSFGLQRVETGECSQSQLRDAMARLHPGADYKPIQVPPEWVRWRIAAARRLGEQRSVPEPLGLSSAAKLLEPVPEQAPPHPLEEEGLVLSDEDAKELAKTSGRLHALPEFRGWFPPKEAVDEMMLRVGETVKPGTEPDQADLQQAIDQETCAATDRYFSPQRREQLAQLMHDSALSVLQRAGEQPALDVVATIKAIESAGLITDPPHEVPFLRAFFDKAIAVMIAQGGGQLRIPIPVRPAEEPEEESAPTAYQSAKPAASGTQNAVADTVAVVGATPPPEASPDADAAGDSGSEEPANDGAGETTSGSDAGAVDTSDDGARGDASDERARSGDTDSE